MKKIGLLLSGCGVYDGTEIHEAVFSLLAILENGGQPLFMAPNINQMHVVNHLSGEEMPESRNVLIESARIARGDIEDLANVHASDIEGLVMPGGFGAAKNHTDWAVNGPDGTIHPEVKRIINEMIDAGKPIVALCMSPTTIAKALENSGKKVHLTVGTTAEPSPYEIEAISQGMEKTGAQAEMKTVREIAVDESLKVITAPCYMMEASALQVRDNIKLAIDQLFHFL